MALQRDTLGPYVGRWNAANAAHPQGSFKNLTVPGDGSYFDEDWSNDWDGFFSSLLDGGGFVSTVAPNELVDEVGASQYFDQMLAIIDAKIEASPGSKTGYITQSSDTPANMLTEGFLELKEGARFVSQTTYADLFAVIGSGYGDEGGDFGLPPVKPSVRPDYSHPGVWVEVAPAVPSSGDASPKALAFNPVNGDQWYADSNTTTRLYLKAGGAGAWVSVDVSALTLNDLSALAIDWKREELWLGDSGANELHQINYDGTLIETYTSVQVVDVDVYVEQGTVFVTQDSGPATGLFRLNRSESVPIPLEPVSGWPVEVPSAVPSRVCVDQDSGDVTVMAPNGEVWRVAFGETQDVNARFYTVGDGDVPAAGGDPGASGLTVDPGNKDLAASTLVGNNVYISSGGDSVWTLTDNLVPGILNPNDLEFNPFDGSLWVALPSSGAAVDGTMYRLPATQLTEGVKSYIKS